MRVHLVIPDTQVAPDVPLDHLDWIGRYIVDIQPDVVVHLGDHADFPSLSSYDRHKSCFHGRRYQADLHAARKGWRILNAPLIALNKRQVEGKRKLYKPEKHITLGNHEDRLTRAVAMDAVQLEGVISLDDLGYAESGWTVHPFLKPVVLDGVHYCLERSHKVLTKDLRYVRLDELSVGDELFAFDEDSPGPRCGRRYKSATVEALGMDTRPLFEVELNNGKKFRATADHLWLARKRGTTNWTWIRTDELIVGASEACQVMPEWEPDQSYWSGWLAGMFDGEGHLSKPNCKQGGIQIGIGQRFGPMLDRILSVLDSLAVPNKVAAIGGTNNDVANVRIGGASGQKIRLLGIVRPERLISKLKPEMLGRVQKMDGVSLSVVKSITPVGMGEIVKIKTSTGTMIVEGYAHHNCHYFYQPMTGRAYGGQNLELRLKNIGHSFTMGHQQGKLIAERHLSNGTTQRGLVVGSCYMHDEDYKGPQANHHWRGIIVKHEVAGGSYDLMEVSLDFLCRKYEQMRLSTFLSEKYPDFDTVLKQARAA